MPEAYFHLPRSSLTMIKRPHCPKCQNHLSLIRIVTASRGFDIRTFKCGRCDYVHIATVETDLMKSAKAGWQNSGLKAPE